MVGPRAVERAVAARADLVPDVGRARQVVSRRPGRRIQEQDLTGTRHTMGSVQGASAGPGGLPGGGDTGGGRQEDRQPGSNDRSATRMEGRQKIAHLQFRSEAWEGVV